MEEEQEQEQEGSGWKHEPCDLTQLSPAPSLGGGIRNPLFREHMEQ
jgi:hypothetical protein